MKISGLGILRYEGFTDNIIQIIQNRIILLNSQDKNTFMYGILVTMVKKLLRIAYSTGLNIFVSLLIIMFI